MDITLVRLCWAEIAVNFALIIANVSIHIRARRLLKSADMIYQEAIAFRRQAEQALDDAQHR